MKQAIQAALNSISMAQPTMEVTSPPVATSEGPCLRDSAPNTIPTPPSMIPTKLKGPVKINNIERIPNTSEAIAIQYPQYYCWASDSRYALISSLVLINPMVMM